MIEFSLGMFWGLLVALLISVIVTLWMVSLYIHKKRTHQDNVAAWSDQTDERQYFDLCVRFHGAIKDMNEILRYEQGRDWRGSYSHVVNHDGSLTIVVVSEIGNIPIDSFPAGSWSAVGVYFGDEKPSTFLPDSDL